MMNDLYISTYNPDVLSCIANLSSDEVFTPPEVANAVLDMLPQELFTDPNTTFLDPAVKSGVFLREIAKRLLKGLEPVIPDLQERIDHIFQKQLFGIAITEITSLLGRRSLYCSKYPNSVFSVTKFASAEGNIRYKNMHHRWADGKCIFCGASESEYGGKKREGMESHAYELIHTTRPEEIFKMKFDVIIGNPPYQLSDGGAQASAKPIYHLFVEQAQKLNPRYLSMIIPARWYAGGKGLEEFRSTMLSDKHIQELHDFPNTDDCFPGVNIRGGICYFLWSKEYDNQKGKTKVVTHEGKEEHSTHRLMKYRDLDIFVRHEASLSILDKVLAMCGNKTMNNHVSSLRPFGFRGYFTQDERFRPSQRGVRHPIACYGKGKTIGYVERSEIEAHVEWIDSWKVYIPRANNIGTELNDDNLNAFVGQPQTICTESYLVLGADLGLSEEMSKNMSIYYRTKFVRFLHSMAKSSQDATSKTHRFIPVEDFTKEWTDAELYEKYGLTEEEIAFIESMIKPMEL